MKDAILPILQSRMDKCTSEQFWAAGAIAALNAYLIAQRDDLVGNLPGRVIPIFSSLVAVYALYFVFHRHFAYYALLREFIAVVHNEPAVPDALKKYRSPWKGHSLSGVVFYAGVVVVSTVGVVASYHG